MTLGPRCFHVLLGTNPIACPASHTFPPSLFEKKTGPDLSCTFGALQPDYPYSVLLAPAHRGVLLGRRAETAVGARPRVFSSSLGLRSMSAQRVGDAVRMYGS